MLPGMLVQVASPRNDRRHDQSWSVRSALSCLRLVGSHPLSRQVPKLGHRRERNRDPDPVTGQDHFGPRPLVRDRISHSFLRHVHHPGTPAIENSNSESVILGATITRPPHSSSCGVTRPFLQSHDRFVEVLHCPVHARLPVVDITGEPSAGPNAPELPSGRPSPSSRRRTTSRTCA